MKSKGGQQHRVLGSSEQLNCDLSKEIRNSSREKDKYELRFDDGKKQTNTVTWSVVTWVQGKVSSNICQYEHMGCGLEKL